MRRKFRPGSMKSMIKFHMCSQNIIARQNFSFFDGWRVHPFLTIPTNLPQRKMHRSKERPEPEQRLARTGLDRRKKRLGTFSQGPIRSKPRTAHALDALPSVPANTSRPWLTDIGQSFMKFTCGPGTHTEQQRCSIKQSTHPDNHCLKSSRTHRFRELYLGLKVIVSLGREESYTRIIDGQERCIT